MTDAPAAMIEPAAVVERADWFETEQIRDSSLEPMCRRVMAGNRRKLTLGTRESCNCQFLSAGIDQGHVDGTGIAPQTGEGPAALRELSGNR